MPASPSPHPSCSCTDGITSYRQSLQIKFFLLICRRRASSLPPSNNITSLQPAASIRSPSALPARLAHAPRPFFSFLYHFSC
ncbi:hypothetical protein AAFF_G00079810 [Aldrovandia affinis]|uniref:Uncharacterized protein n=1 Tax=Aldrovandia affinis TaxID=143900 RepID=A0AAD7R1S8_9TELE|nr:hypothetical protein AAFF_G00079810 [Aldrovandia affinis]